MDNLLSQGQFDLTVLTVGSAEGVGVCHGGSTAGVMCGNKNDDFRPVDTLRKRGAIPTSSYATEVRALVMAVDLLHTQPAGLVGLKTGSCQWRTTLLSSLNSLPAKVVLLWIAGKCILDGNKMAD